MLKTLIILLTLTLITIPLDADVPQSVNAKDFGAVGDGVTDDTAAILKALEEIAPGGGVAHLPAGKYLISDSLLIPNGCTLLGEGARWESSATQLIIEKEGFPAVRLGHVASVKGLAIVYPNNADNANPRPYPPAIQLDGINPSVENIVFSNAWIGVSTPPGGGNAGQGMFRDLTGFVHHVGIHLSGSLDVNRIQDVHWFVGGNNTPGKESYFHKNRVGFQFGRVDGIILDRCFMIFGKTFFHQLPYRDSPEGNQEPAHSLGFAIDNCWIEHVENGFIFEGYTGFTLSNTNILINKGGIGVKVDAQSLFYNAAINGIQVRGHNGPFIGIEYNAQKPHGRNRLAISNSQVTDGMPAVHLKSGAQRAQISNCHLSAVEGQPSIRIDEGADLFTITNNIFNVKNPIEDNSGTDARKTISGNLTDAD